MSTLVEVTAISKRFRLAHGDELWGVKDVSLTIGVGETVALVGESGSGKTTLGRLMLRLATPTEGSVTIAGVDLLRGSRRDVRTLRGRVQAVFQNPRDALSPRRRIAASVAEPLTAIEPKLDADEVRRRVGEAADLVHFPQAYLDRRPHELSAGEQQRAALARAIVTRPAFVVLDEPTSMLDASLRAGLVRTFAELQRTLGVSFLFISHDFVSVAGLSHRIAVMYLGTIVELGPAASVLRNPLHPYTQALLGAVPVVASTQPERAVVLDGEIPSPVDRPAGCPLVDRCPFAQEHCAAAVPPLTELDPRHEAACFVAAERHPLGEWAPVVTPGRWLALRGADGPRPGVGGMATTAEHPSTNETRT
ncbi:MAG: peptide/nickel transport system ATP-binding protein [Solirubrobacteraceae bacterium]|jgi:oligopeptide/dipeptide ABC transporter ATP-binding protein|nr:peptide/nickel transport system ATP-binding protein [Solirubrobacteraceae bacterium]